MLAQLSSGVRVINLDQTWLNQLNFHRRKWRLHGQTHSETLSGVSPRVSMQLAICTSGRLYCAMSQANTDSQSFCLFISSLAKKLNKEERGSVAKSLLLIDEARY